MLDNHECYEELANAIIIKAVEDYRQACQIIKLNKDKFIVRQAQNEKERIVRFIKSSYYESLTAVPSSTLLLKLKSIEKEVMNDGHKLERDKRDND